MFITLVANAICRNSAGFVGIDSLGSVADRKNLAFSTGPAPVVTVVGVCGIQSGIESAIYGLVIAVGGVNGFRRKAMVGAGNNRGDHVDAHFLPVFAWGL